MTTHINPGRDTTINPIVINDTHRSKPGPAGGAAVTTRMVLIAPRQGIVIHSGMDVFTVLTCGGCDHINHCPDAVKEKKAGRS